MDNFENIENKPEEVLKLRIVIISDTHNDHRSLVVPLGDVLIHAGDYTCYGKIEHAKDFNNWLGELPFEHKIVINGNHESNAPWRNKVEEIVCNATYLKQKHHVLKRKDGSEVKIFGTDFFWPCVDGNNPHYDEIEDDVSIIVSHGPAKGQVDGMRGCPALRAKCDKLHKNGSLKLVIGGHIHFGYGESIVRDQSGKDVRYVNASMCGGERKVINQPIVVEI